MLFNNGDKNENLIKRLEDAVKQGKVSHAYIFESSANTHKKDFAKSFVKGILCPDGRGENCGKCAICDKIDHDNHEDIHYVKRDGLNVKVEAIEQMQSRLNIRPVGSRNIVIIDDADAMNNAAQNKLLKTLEEPPGDSVIILLSENMLSLLQTVQSRCVKYRINCPALKVKASIEDKALSIAEMSLRGADYYEMREKMGNLIKDKEDIKPFLDELERVYANKLRENFVDSNKLYDRIYDVEDALKRIDKNVSPTVAVKEMLLRFCRANGGNI